MFHGAAADANICIKWNSLKVIELAKAGQVVEMDRDGDSPSELWEGEIPLIKAWLKANKPEVPHLAAGLAQLGQLQQKDSEEHLPISVWEGVLISFYLH